MIPIMLVEDEFLVRVGLKTCIDWEKLGYQIVAEADSGEAALEKYFRFKPMLVLTDIRLPHKNGIEVMQEIHASSKDVRFIIISAYDDFTVAQQAIEIGVEGYFLKGSLDTDKLEHLLSDLHERIFSRLEPEQPGTETGIADLCKNWESIQDPGTIQRIRSRGKGLYAALFRTKPVSVNDLTGMVCSYLQEQNVEYRCWKETDRVWFLFSCPDRSVKGLMERLQSMMERYLNFGISVGISTDYFLHENMENTLYEALLAAMYPHDRQIHVEHYREHRGEIQREQLKRYDELLQLNRVTEAVAVLHEIYDQLIRSYSVSSFLSNVYRISGVLTGYGIQAAEFRQLEGMLDTEKMFQLFRDRTMQLEQTGIARDQSNVYVKKVKDYIYQNMDVPVRIGTLAENIHVSANYLGKVFQHETGEYLTDYISRVKVERARELLGQHKYSVLEVAAMVGIPDQRYFSKVFKKFTGITPSEYASGAGMKQIP